MNFNEQLDNLIIWHIPFKKEAQKNQFKRKVIELIESEVIGESDEEGQMEHILDMVDEMRVRNEFRDEIALFLFPESQK